jgi:DNA-binding transcriptional ArsR family regulator
MRTETDHETAGGTRDELFEAMADRQRRRAVGVLREAGEGLTLTELAEELARRAERDPEATTDVERLRIELYHRHLPCLDGAGLVAFDAEAKTATLLGTVPAAVAESGTTMEIA